jgi:hypothetical protein
MQFAIISISQALLSMALSAGAPAQRPTTILVEGESFADLGGWVVDQQ